MELNGARERVGLPPLPYTHGGISRELAIVATFPQLEYPRRRAVARDARDRAAAVGAAVRRRGAAARRRAARAGGAEHVAGPGAAARASGARGAGGRAGAGAGHDSTGARSPSPDPGARQRAARRLGLVRADDAAVRRRRLPRRPRDGGAVAGERRAGGRVRPRGRPGRERRPDPLGGRRACRSPAASRRRPACAWRCTACSPTRATAAAPRSCATGRRRTTAAAAPRTPSRSSPDGAKVRVRPQIVRKERVDVRIQQIA